MREKLIDKPATRGGDEIRYLPRRHTDLVRAGIINQEHPGTGTTYILMFTYRPRLHTSERLDFLTITNKTAQSNLERGRVATLVADLYSPPRNRLTV